MLVMFEHVVRRSFFFKQALEIPTQAVCLEASLLGETTCLRTVPSFHL